MDETLPKIQFLKLKGRGWGGGGALITPQGWMGVDSMDSDHKISQNIHIKIFLMRGQKIFEFSRTWFLSCLNMGII